jgi:hypothetical protein
VSHVEHGETKNLHHTVDNAQDKTPHGRPMHRWENDIKMDIRGSEYEHGGIVRLCRDKEFLYHCMLQVSKEDPVLWR